MADNAAAKSHQPRIMVQQDIIYSQTHADQLATKHKNGIFNRDAATTSELPDAILINFIAATTPSKQQAHCINNTDTQSTPSENSLALDVDQSHVCNTIDLRDTYFVDKHDSTHGFLAADAPTVDQSHGCNKKDLRDTSFYDKHDSIHTLNAADTPTVVDIFTTAGTQTVVDCSRQVSSHRHNSSSLPVSTLKQDFCRSPVDTKTDPSCQHP